MFCLEYKLARKALLTGLGPRAYKGAVSTAVAVVQKSIDSLAEYLSRCCVTKSLKVGPAELVQ